MPDEHVDRLARIADRVREIGVQVDVAEQLGRRRRRARAADRLAEPRTGRLRERSRPAIACEELAETSRGENLSRKDDEKRADEESDSVSPSESYRAGRGRARPQKASQQGTVRFFHGRFNRRLARLLWTGRELALFALSRIL